MPVTRGWFRYTISATDPYDPLNYIIRHLLQRVSPMVGIYVHF
jgi:predicted DNA-binding transcriptional regulator